MQKLSNLIHTTTGFPLPSLRCRVYYFFELVKVVVEFTLEWPQVQMSRNLFTLLLIACVIHSSNSASPKGESCHLWKRVSRIAFLSSVGECERSDGKCSEAKDCKYIWTDTFDCTVHRKVCCYNDHDYIDLGWHMAIIERNANKSKLR